MRVILTSSLAENETLFHIHDSDLMVDFAIWMSNDDLRGIWESIGAELQSREARSR